MCPDRDSAHLRPSKPPTSASAGLRQHGLARRVMRCDSPDRKGTGTRRFRREQADTLAMSRLRVWFRAPGYHTWRTSVVVALPVFAVWAFDIGRARTNHRVDELGQLLAAGRAAAASLRPVAARGRQWETRLVAIPGQARGVRHGREGRVQRLSHVASTSDRSRHRTVGRARTVRLSKGPAS